MCLMYHMQLDEEGKDTLIALNPYYQYGEWNMTTFYTQIFIDITNTSSI